jgi:enterochelin esterase-like enzyme
MGLKNCNSFGVVGLGMNQVLKKTNRFAFCLLFLLPIFSHSYAANFGCNPLLVRSVYSLLNQEFSNFSFEINRISPAQKGQENFKVSIKKNDSTFDRDVHIYIPKNAYKNLNSKVVFMTDGQNTGFYNKFLHSDQQVKKYHPLVVIGMESHERLRGSEYLNGTMDQPLYDVHSHVFKEILPKLVDIILGVSLPASRRVLFGFSNGASFVYQASIESPEIFPNVIVVSLPKSSKPYSMPKKEGGNGNRKMFFANGDLGEERFFLKNTKNVYRRLLRYNSSYSTHEVYTGLNHEAKLATLSLLDGIH